MSDTVQSPGPIPTASVSPQPLVSVDSAMMLAAGKGIGKLFLALISLILSGLTSGYTVGQVLKSGVTQELEKVPPIIKRLIPPPTKAEEAIGRIIFGRSGCTATVMGPIWSDDPTIDILTAAHCVKVGDVGTMTLKNGQKFLARCVARDEKSDAAWLRAARPDGDTPYLLLADETPLHGSPVWHQGYGVDKPGNREVGIYQGVATDRQQCIYALSVSSGDSGGAIITTQAGRVLSPVCCTTNLARKGVVWGATPGACAAIRPARSVPAMLSEVVYPSLDLPSGEWPESI